MANQDASIACQQADFDELVQSHAHGRANDGADQTLVQEPSHPPLRVTLK